MKKIYYNFYDSLRLLGEDDLADSVWFDDRFLDDIKSSYLEENKTLPFYQCPSWSHKVKRTFTVKSPIDIKFDIDFDYEPPMILSNLEQSIFDSIIRPTYSQPSWFLRDPNRLILQLSIPILFCWTDDRNIWIEQKPHPLTSLKNNFSLVGGWFNLSSWIRPLSFALDICDVTKPLVIKKGDPIYQISFYSKNLNENYKLIRSIPSEKIKKQTQRNMALKYYGNHLTEKHIFTEQKSKCPFRFLFNN
jgi:hypothetical protein